MSQYVIVSYGPDREYEVTVPDADTASLTKEQARAWLAKEFETLECSPSNPMGKILVLDMVLNVAKYGDEDNFKRLTEWARQFAAATLVALGRPVITVDIGNHVVR